jgi:membrane-bound metal-dependent hydrolase YbcI (DUF457 family)
MPSPIAHTAAGYALYRLLAAPRLEEETSLGRSFPRLLLIVALSMLPDLDFLPGLLLNEFDRFHNTFSNSLLLAFPVALLIAAIFSFKQKSRFLFWFGFVFLCYELHVVMDYFTVGRGVLLFWPISSERYQPAFKLFYGLHRSDGWFSIRHLWTLLSELAFVALIRFMTGFVVRK